MLVGVQFYGYRQDGLFVMRGDKKSKGIVLFMPLPLSQFD